MKTPEYEPQICNINSASDSHVTPRRVPFVQVPIAVVADSEISSGAFRLLCVLHAYARQEDSTWVGQEVLAEALSVNVMSIRRWKKELEQAGLIATERRGQRRTNVTTLALEDEIRRLYAGSLGRELPRKRGPYASQSQRSPGQTSRGGADADASPPLDIEATEAVQSHLDRTHVSGTGSERHCPVPMEVQAQEGEAARTTTHVDQEKTIEENAHKRVVLGTRPHLTYVHNDAGLTQVFLGPLELQDRVKVAGLWEVFVGAALLARALPTRLREQVLEMSMDATLAVQDQVLRFEQGVLDVREEPW